MSLDTVLPLEDTEIFRTTSIPVSIITAAFMLCEPITSANTARDFFGYVFLKIRANERRGFLSAFGGNPVAVMCLDKSFQSVESHFPESVFAIHKYCVRKLLTLWNGHEGEIQLTETRYSTVVARGLYRLRFAKPTQPFPSIDPYFRQFDKVTSLDRYGHRHSEKHRSPTNRGRRF